MQAIDTNVVVRYLTGDDPEQAAKARDVIDTGGVFVSTTVLLGNSRLFERPPERDTSRVQLILGARADAPTSPTCQSSPYFGIPSPARTRAAKLPAASCLLLFSP